MTKTEIRAVLKIPKGIRIAQHIYNLFRDYEMGGVETINDVQIDIPPGIDIFYVEDDEFVKRINYTNKFCKDCIKKVSKLIT